MKPLVIDIHHDLDRAEVRRRMQAGVAKLPGHIPGGTATVRSAWPSEDRMTVDVQAMGQEIATILDVGDRSVRVEVMLPGLLALMAGPIEAVIRRSGEKLLLTPPSA
ncbi:polyhydroxyalkanoic acid system family protein [Sphingobium sufflavum]|uniref:polyhydroxyalkanoic acid system family protein n=1 Tax=Sphingobium sufflavum TaxID=1129547 RepID=UPI001F2CED61|nr:polyhydroxyalkanoic acid system family protein [Sphingobium sufflavum]MCE7797152.1 polyhydroxyalkanoic acid system family protein [Sphingobium sufflavum]